MVSTESAMQIEDEIRSSRVPQVPPSKQWIFTWNHYPEDWRSTIDEMVDLAETLTCQEEVGESGTPHIQGAVKFLRKIRPVGYRGWPRTIHWEKRRAPKGPTGDSQFFGYCTKDDTYVGGSRVNHNWSPPVSYDLEESDLLEPLPWQRDFIDGLLSKPDAREIVWCWEPQGGIGKTELARRLCLLHGAVFIQGAKRHILASAYQNPAGIYIMGLARTQESYVSYESLECLKDGIFMSGFGTKATGMVLRKPPHVVVLANFPPDESKLSADRWSVIDLREFM